MEEVRRSSTAAYRNYHRAYRARHRKHLKQYNHYYHRFYRRLGKEGASDTFNIATEKSLENSPSNIDAGTRAHCCADVDG